METTRQIRRTAIVMVTSALWLVSCPSLAQDGGLEEARQQFREALSQEAAGDWTGALKKLEAVARVKVTAQVRYHMAKCKEHLGRLTEALGEYVLAAQQATESTDVSEITRAKSDLETRIPKLRIDLPDSVAGARVVLDGVELGATQLARELPVNPGLHRVIARLGERQWGQNVTAKEGKSLRIDLTPDDDAPEPKASRKETKPPADDATSGGSAAPWIAGGIGAAGLLGAGVFYLLRSSAENDLDSGCRGSVCPESLHGTQDKSDRYRLMAGISLGVGIVGLGTAAVLLLTGDAPDKKQAARGFSMGASASQNWAGMSARGAF